MYRKLPLSNEEEMWLYQKANYAQSGNPNWRGGKEIPCAQCGTLIYRSPCQLKRNKNNFCSSNCHDEFRRKPRDPNRLRRDEMKGSRHPRWTGPRFCRTCEEELLDRDSRKRGYCSDGCKEIGHEKARQHHIEERHKAALVDLVCPYCDKTFQVLQGHVDRRTHCSAECSILASRNRQSFICETCGDVFEVPQSVVDARARKGQKVRFCSTPCYLRFSGRTTLEIRVAEALETLGINFEEQFSPKRTRKVFDFFLPDLDIVIEADGDYWHYSEMAEKRGVVARDKAKDRYAKNKGWHVVRLKETDVKEYGAIALICQALEQLGITQ